MMANENDGILRNNNGDEKSTNSNQKDESTVKNISNIQGDYRNIRATSTHAEPRREENPFSFKHFLNRDPTNNTSKITVQSNTSNQTTSFLSSSSNNNEITKQSTTVTSSINSSPPITAIVTTISPNLTSNELNSLTSTATPSLYQKSTGARPKVPQSTSTSSSIDCSAGPPYQTANISTTSMSSLINSETSKMKRSPRFSSFDSQASLNEYSYNVDKILKDAGQVLDDPGKNSNNTTITTTTTTTTTLNQIGNVGTNNCSSPLNLNNYNKMFVPRSYSNYDMDLPTRNSSSFTISANSGNSSVGNNNRENNSSPIIRRTSPARPNRLSGISSQQSQSTTSNKTSNQMLTSSSSSSSNKNISNVGGLHCRPNSEFAAALPDFVQDHWMDPWYFNEMHLNSPPNSPHRQQSPSPLNFVRENLPAGMANPPGCNVGGGNSEKCQTLPDFLSDGPIIHSSGRLADVAVGLPNLDSPDDNSPNLQLSRIRLENERLRRELDESRIALAEQTRRSGDLERHLEQARNNESTFNRTLAQNIGQVEENLDQSKKQAAAAQNQVTKLKLQVKQLTTKIEILRRENESLREEGAVGGSIRNDLLNQRPSRYQQMSRDLLQVASTAENSLRQLLGGVENLRTMAASIDNTSHSNDYDNQNNSSINIINDDFLSDCDDDFDDFSGPAL